MNPALATRVDKGPNLRVVQPKPRSFNDVIAEGRGRNPHKEWSQTVDKKVGELLSKKGEVDSRLSKVADKHPGASRKQLLTLVRREARDDVLANDRSYWM